ncbi:unnamed protein product [Victoria cruziana]
MEGDEDNAIIPAETGHSPMGSENLAKLLDSRDEEDQFEQVSLKDQERTVIESTEKGGSRRSSASDAVSQFSGNDEAYGSPSLRLAELNSSMANAQDDHGSSPGSAKHPAEMLKSVSSVSVDSASSQAGDSGSPLYSPPKARARPALPDVSPELVHLVETAIQGEADSLQKLGEIVTGEESVMGEEEVVGISRLVVDVLLATMGGVEGFDDSGDGNPPSIMLNARAAVVAGQLIPWLPCEGDSASYMSPRTRMVKGLFLILKACTRNRTMCSNESLLGVLLSAAEMVFMQGSNKMGQEETWDASWLCRCLQLLAQHSISVPELHRWLEVVTNTVTTGWSSHLMLALEKAIGGRETSGPACTFEFDGESSGLLGPGESRWPFSNGYAFVTWLYIESFADTVNTATAAAAIAAAAAAKSGKSSAMSAAAAASALAGEGTAHMPRLYSFLSADNQGVEAYFHGQFLVVESGAGKGKKASLHFTHAFKPQCWYFVGLEHTYKQSLLGKAESELRLYVDGTLYESRPFEFPRISKPLAFCCIGTNPPPTMAGLQRRRRQCPLFAEMGPVYIFKEPIGPERMARIASRGGDVLPSFGHGAGAPWLATNEYSRTLAEESYLLDAEIGGKLHLLYHPRLLSGRFCPDASPSGATGIHRRPAEVLGQVYVACRVRPSESLWAMAEGGPMCLLPLAVSKAHPDTLKPEHGGLDLSVATATLSAPILRIISLAIQHHGNNQELCHVHGPEILAVLLRYLLETLSSLDIGQQSGVKDEELVAAVVSLCQSQKRNPALKVELFHNLLLDLKMWSLCSYGIQKKLLSSLADMVFSESSAMREANAVQMLLDGCRKCYWTIHEADSIDTFSLQGALRPMGEVNALVDELLVVIELLVGASSASKAVDDVRCLIGFLVDCPQANQVARVLHLFYRLIVQPNANRAHLFAESFISCGGIETLLVLLQREAKTGDHVKSSKSVCNGSEKKIDKEPVLDNIGSQDELRDASAHVVEEAESVTHDELNVKSFRIERCSPKVSMDSRIERMASVSESLLMRNLGGISFSITADSARNNVYNVDNDDGIVVGVISLLGAMLASGQIKFANSSTSTIPNNSSGNELPCEGTNMFADKVSLLLFALQKAFQAAPQRLMTANIYTTLLGVTVWPFLLHSMILLFPSFTLESINEDDEA